ncbi:hypothetical protein ES708_08105 [subsurface metagenome]
MPKIPKELIERRTANSKTFDLGKGRRQLVAHIGDVHYKDNYADLSERWKDIDLTWEGNRITKAPYELVHTGKKLTLKDKKTGEVSTIELLESKPAGLKWEIIPEFTRVRFRHNVPSDKIPFEAKFKVTGRMPFGTRASDDEGELELETTLADGILTEKLSSVKDKETGEARAAVGSIKIDPTWEVGASSDDAHRELGTGEWSLTYSGVVAGASGATLIQFGCGMRFTNITIPQASTINQAYLTLRAILSKSANDVNTRISAEDVDDAPTFADNAAAFDARWANRTTTRVDWNTIPAWTAGLDYDSPEIKTVIKEIVDRGGWNSGQAIVIFWEDFEDRSTHVANAHRIAASWDRDTTPPQLIIDYTAGVAYEKTLAESLGLADKVVKAPSVVRTESLGLLDTYDRTWAAYRVYPEILGLSDTVVKAPALIRTEYLGLVDTVIASKLFLKVLTELLGLSDTVKKDTSKVLTEDLGLLDVYGRTWSVYRTYDELLGLADSIQKDIALHPLVEPLGLIDSVVKSPSITRGEPLGLKDAVVKDASKILAEDLGLLDSISIAKALSKILSETLGLVDTYDRVWSAQRTYAESLGLEDRVSKHPSKALTEVLGLLDSISYIPNPTILAKLIRKLIQLESIGGGGQN